MPHEPRPSSPVPAPGHLWLGADGLRAGWSLLVFLLTAGLLVYGESVVARHFLPRRALTGAPMAPGRFVPSEAVAFLTAATAAWLVSRVERRQFGRYGLNLKRSGADLLAGILCGFVALSVLVGSLRATHSLVFDGVAVHGTPAVTYGAEWALGFFLVGCFEEFLTRGFLQYTVARGISGVVRLVYPNSRHLHAVGFWSAAFLFSVLLFMAGHLGNKGETPFGIVAVGAAGLTFAFSLWRTGTLWWAIGFHAAWDWAQSFLYGVADSGSTVAGHLLNTHPAGSPLLSGGSTGPEGSVLVLPTLLLVCLVIHVSLPRRNYPLPYAQETKTGPM